MFIHGISSWSAVTLTEFYIAFTVHFHLVFSNQQMHTLKLFYSFISITEFPYICFGR
jgi:hypothetical protein